MPTFTVFRGSKDGVIKKSETTKDKLTRDQVLVNVTASGLCGTDLHYKTADMALGHEGVGVVAELGPDAKHLKKGDRVGWGYVHDCCGACEYCLTGNETHCAERAMYGMADLDQGSFASQAVWREAFLFKIPDAISDEDAAPLQCGGTTVWNALYKYDTRPDEVVGVMGVGGLGHLAIQFANKMGCHVVVISGTDSKKTEAMKLGAHEFVASKGAKELKTSRPLDRLLVTTSALPDWNLIAPILAPLATIHPLSVDNKNFEFPYMSLVGNGLRIQGSIVAARCSHRRMLEFAALHGIKPVVETFPMTEEGIKEAVEKLEKGQMRYRGVLVPKK
ncbi:GroES-like protein [Piedraia hortae CBS 480.64]|uniref:GroES-like protein n=1 Tax=Piedraia hortae CBS 480.64 TaxID=1314780 RepID=A0A6A7C1H0_9PEZI|nr:GroES-like protein [Piedraia hortae CBS 480.64]